MAMFILVMNVGPGQASKLIWVSLSLAVGACGPMPDSADENDAPLQLAPATGCPALPDGTDPQAVAAYERLNAYRQAAGVGCATFDSDIATAAEEHCEYYAENAKTPMCVASPHREVEGCKGYHGSKSSDRLKEAKYSGQPAYEAMTYVGKGSKAVDLWVDSVWHRVPMLSPWVRDAGYGHTAACDTMDFGWSKVPDEATPPVMYPFDGQTGLPRSWDGATESPAVPPPPSGWPSGYPIMLYMADLKVDSHTLLDGEGKPVDHGFLAPGDKESLGILLNEFAMYAYKPLAKQTTYRVVIEGKRDGKDVHVEWSFTTR